MVMKDIKQIQTDLNAAWRFFRDNEQTEQKDDAFYHRIAQEVEVIAQEMETRAGRNVLKILFNEITGVYPE